MLTNEKLYYILRNVQRGNIVDLDFNVVEVSNDLDMISSRYFEKEQHAAKNYRKSFTCISSDTNDGKDYWSFDYSDEKGNEITYVLCGYRKVRDFVTHI